MGRKRQPPSAPEPAILTKDGFATWRTPRLDSGHDLRLKDEPSVFNGMVDVYRYRITVERIEEPKEVIAERLVDLCRSTNNIHHREALYREAERLGINLSDLLRVP